MHHIQNDIKFEPDAQDLLHVDTIRNLSNEIYRYRFYTISDNGNFRLARRIKSLHFALWQFLLIINQTSVVLCYITVTLCLQGTNVCSHLQYVSYDSLYLFPLQWHHNERVSNHQPHHCLPNRLFRRRSKKTPKHRVTGPCARNSPVTGEFPAEMASNAENVSIWWRHHAIYFHLPSLTGTSQILTRSCIPKAVDLKLDLFQLTSGHCIL